MACSPTTTSPDHPPMLLTDDSSFSEDAQRKQRRRQTAIYPNTLSSVKQQKPFSRSAAKRESVMALGSIEHLQYYFTKTGLAAEKPSLTKSTKALVPAIGGINQLNTSKPLTDPLPELRLPPTPIPPSPPRPAFPNVPKNYETNPDSLLPSVIHNLATVEHLWSTPLLTQQHVDTAVAQNAPINVLDLLKSTTLAIREVRNYLVSLPDDSAGTIRANFRPKSLPSIAPQNKSRSTSRADPTSDPLTLIRRTALEVLATLRQLEESARLPLSDDPFDLNSEHASASGPASIPASRPTSSLSAPENPLTVSHTRPRSPLPNRPDSIALEPSSPVPSYASGPDASFSFVHIQRDGRDQFVPVWDPEDPDDLLSLSLPPSDDASSQDAYDQQTNEAAARERRERWDSRLVLGAGWLYRQDLTLDELGAERTVVGRYLDVVDAVLFGGAKDGKRGWASRERARGGRGLKEGRDVRRRASEGDGLGGRLKPPVARRVASSAGTAEDGSMVLAEEPEELDLAGMTTVNVGEEHERTAKDGPDGLDEGEEGPLPDDDLPLWAQRSAFLNDDLGRAHALLTAFLPVSLLSSLAPITALPVDPDLTENSINPSEADTTTPTSNRHAFLQSLSSGQLLCVAYNACVRRSYKPWGFISADAIHDVIGLQGTAAAVGKHESKIKERENEGESEKGKKVWTFRRTENLRKWAGTLRVRYLLPIATPSTAAPNTISTLAATANGNGVNPIKQVFVNGSATNTATTIGTGTGPNTGSIHFDPSIVARGEEGWEDMLQAILLRWVAAVVDERRGEDES